MKGRKRLILVGVILVLIGFIILCSYIKIIRLDNIESYYLEDLEKANNAFNNCNSDDMKDIKKRLCFNLKKHRILHMAVYKIGYLANDILYILDRNLFCISIPYSIVKNCDECFATKSEDVLMKQINRFMNRSMKTQEEYRKKKFEPEESNVNFWVKTIDRTKGTKKSYFVKLIEKFRNKKFMHFNYKRFCRFIYEASKPLQKDIFKNFYTYDQNWCYLSNRSSYCVFLKDKMVFYILKDAKSDGEFIEKNYEIKVLNFKFDTSTTIDLVACLYKALEVQNS
ncbi:hypothetical protein CWI38_0263p0020 [Hamiltosporidium tvaerminnensis]|uniref:Uncharacterized protein n=1 Tax=Hamiltosporidium tvaerminnensis TaxID=1176355 RepID=A0A4Q9LYX3_9MICR|nr:hypothetical protein CWI38_0263p0020 [Hamiltosporidium tvaerminnensis]